MIKISNKMPKLMYGFLFTSEIKNFVDADSGDMNKIISELNELFDVKDTDIEFGVINEDDEDFHIFAGIEITNDLFEDGEGKFFSMDLDQIKANNKVLEEFFDNHEELEEVAYCNSPRIFFINNDE